MAEPKKLTTQEILELARQKKAAEAAASQSPAPAPSSAPESTSVEVPSTGEPTAAAPASPKTTAEILAAARASKTAAASEATGAGTPPATPAVAPKSTADILAAARANKSAASASPPPAAAPKSTADILAAARANKAAGATPTASEKPAAQAATPVAGSSIAPVSSGDRPPLKEMVAAVKAADEGMPVAAARPPVAAKPKLPAGNPRAEVSRRTALGTLGAIVASPFIVAWIGMSAVAGAWGLGIARFMMPNMVLELPSKFKIGPPSDFPPGTVSEKYKASRGVYIVHTTQYDGRDLIFGLFSICTHLGCTPNWLEGEQKFKCPCHGSGFYITGINFEGPAPRPLERVGLRRAEDGMLEVDKSVKFQEELGQWSDGKSFFEMT